MRVRRYGSHNTFNGSSEVHGSNCSGCVCGCGVDSNPIAKTFATTPTIATMVAAAATVRDLAHMNVDVRCFDTGVDVGSICEHGFAIARMMR